MVLLVVAVGTAGAMRPSIPQLPPVQGYTGCFDEDGALIRDLKAHVAAGKPVLSQLGTELQKPLWYSKNHEYGRRPKYLFHWTSKKDAKLIADAGCILQTEESDGDAYLGKGVYMTAIPGWADPEGVKKNNYGGAMWNKFNKWHKANAYVRVDYEPLVEILEKIPICPRRRTTGENSDLSIAADPDALPLLMTQKNEPQRTLHLHSFPYAYNMLKKRGPTTNDDK